MSALRLPGDALDRAGVPAVIRFPDWESRGVVASFATRRPPGPAVAAGEFNISLAIGGDRSATLANRAALLRHLGLDDKRPATVRQRHWAPVVQLTADWLPEADPDTPAGCGMATADPHVALLIGTSDCLPVLLADAGAGCIAALHIGWRELGLGAVERGIRALLSLGGSRSEIAAWLGPSICCNCYVVGSDVWRWVGRRYPHAATCDAAGRPTIDLSAGVCEALGSFGVEAISIVPYCTFENPLQLFSSRRDGRTGVQGSLIALK